MERSSEVSGKSGKWCMAAKSRPIKYNVTTSYAIRYEVWCKRPKIVSARRRKCGKACKPKSVKDGGMPACFSLSSAWQATSDRSGRSESKSLEFVLTYKLQIGSQDKADRSMLLVNKWDSPFSVVKREIRRAQQWDLMPFGGGWSFGFPAPRERDLWPLGAFPPLTANRRL